jgi:hypothetical protein
MSSGSTPDPGDVQSTPFLVNNVRWWRTLAGVKCTADDEFSRFTTAHERVAEGTEENGCQGRVKKRNFRLFKSELYLCEPSRFSAFPPNSHQRDPYASKHATLTSGESQAARRKKGLT